MSDGFKAPFIGMLGVASLIVLVAAATHCDKNNSKCDKEDGWAVACSTISFAFCLIYLIVWFVKGKQDLLPSGMHELACAAFFFVWWGCGAGVMTFERPFRAPGNGYFGAWAAFIMCGVCAYKLCPQAQQAKGMLAASGDEQLVVLLAGIVLLIQASIDCDDHKCEDELIWAVICSVFAVITALVVVFAGNKIPFNWVALWQLALWAAGWGVLTYRWPYTFVGNGYFSCLIGFILSVKICLTAFNITAGDAKAFVAGGGGGAGAGAGTGATGSPRPSQGWVNDAEQPVQGKPAVQSS